MAKRQDARLDVPVVPSRHFLVSNVSRATYSRTKNALNAQKTAKLASRLSLVPVKVAKLDFL